MTPVYRRGQILANRSRVVTACVVRFLLCCRSVLSRLVMLFLFTVSAILQPVAHAQTQSATDHLPPVISLDLVEQGVLGETQVVGASIKEDQSLESVYLQYRFRGEDSYRKIPMKPISGSDIHTASVETAGVDTDALEYYIEAVDTGGNRAIRGFSFDPLVRMLVPAGSVSQSAVAEAGAGTGDGAVVSTSASDIINEDKGVSKRVVWGIAGLAMVALLVGLAGSSGGDGGGGGGGSTSPVTIEVDPVQ